ncbi:dinitrogenase iron-molybdenum cofactor [Candidatus Microgenomates bacterium]|nr:MAG: dinitrogenase iron-molybdenum cofactor [Candidatus Microgenomates bacterium]
MKIAISSAEKDLEGEISEVFGRSPYFLIVTTENGEVKGFEVVENDSVDQAGGAGVAAAKTVVDKGAEAVISGAVGPRAEGVLEQFRVKIFLKKGKIKKAISEVIE